MRERLRTLMSEATAPLHVVWEEPASIRRRAGRRKLSWRAAVALVSVALLGAGGGVAVGPASPPCAPLPEMPEPSPTFAGGPAVYVEAVSPPRVRVFHAALGVAENVAAELSDRGFYAVMAARTDESVSFHSAVIRYGPGTEEDAKMLRAQLIPDEVSMDFYQTRQGPEVDLILGTRFQHLLPSCG
jgi:LytR cell envelope-related transcriptional attenuator